MDALERSRALVIGLACRRAGLTPRNLGSAKKASQASSKVVSLRTKICAVYVGCASLNGTLESPGLELEKEFVGPTSVQPEKAGGPGIGVPLLPCRAGRKAHFVLAT